MISPMSTWTFASWKVLFTMCELLVVYLFMRNFHTSITAMKLMKYLCSKGIYTIGAARLVGGSRHRRHRKFVRRNRTRRQKWNSTTSRRYFLATRSWFKILGNEISYAKDESVLTGCKDMKFVHYEAPETVWRQKQKKRKKRRGRIGEASHPGPGPSRSPCRLSSPSPATATKRRSGCSSITRISSSTGTSWELTKALLFQNLPGKLQLTLSPTREHAAHHDTFCEDASIHIAHFRRQCRWFGA